MWEGRGACQSNPKPARQGLSVPLGALPALKLSPSAPPPLGPREPVTRPKSDPHPCGQLARLLSEARDCFARVGCV